MFLVYLCQEPPATTWDHPAILLCDVNPINVQWRRRYYEIGNFECEISETEYERILSKDNRVLKNFHNLVIVNDKTNEVGFIHKFEAKKSMSSGLFFLSGNFAECITMDDDVLADYGSFSPYKNSKQMIDYLLRHCVISSKFCSPIEGVKETWDYPSISGKTYPSILFYNEDGSDYEVGMQIYSFLKEEEAGVSIRMRNDNKLGIKSYRGTDRTNSVVFSDSLETIKEYEYSYDSSNYKSDFNYSAVYKYKNDTTSDIYVSAKNTQNPFGFYVLQTIKRANIEYQESDTIPRFIDAKSDLQKQADLEALNHRVVENLSISPNLAKFEYLTDYDLGDKVKVLINELGLESTPRITGVNETYKQGHREIELILGDMKVKHF